MKDSQEQQQRQMDDHGHAQRFCVEPPEIYMHMADGGIEKTKNRVLRESVLGVLAGCFIAFGFSTCMLAAGQLSPEYRKAEPGMFNLLFGAYGFPVGLSMCVINGASLFTSNIAYMGAACIQRKCSAYQGLYVLLLSYFMNLAGALLLVHLMVSGQVFYHREEFTIELAVHKTSKSFFATMNKGILCNWMVCIAVWQGNAAQDITGKLLGVWFPISAFVTMGFEHCVANMFVIPLAIKLGAPISVDTFMVKNLIPSIIGNLIGGGVFVANMYGLAYGEWETAVNSAAAAAWARVTGRPRGGGSSSSSTAGSSLSSSSNSLSEQPNAYVAALPATVCKSAQV